MIRLPTPAANATRLTAARAAAWDTNCLNCGAALGGPFCSQCGQRAVPPDPSVRELVGEAFAELSGWDGKFAETIRSLIRRPGELTRQFIAGRRLSQISPVRLYLTMSLVYFVAAAAAPTLQPRSGVEVPGFSIGASTGAPGRVVKAGVMVRGGALTDAERQAITADIATAPRVLRPILRRAAEDPNGFRRDMLENMPRVLFALLPVFAGIVGLFYRGRHFPEHLYFALHLHALVFLALTIPQLAKFTHVVPLATTVGVACALWVGAYAFVAMRRVYGGSVIATLAKGAAITALYGVCGLIGLVVLAYWSALVG